MNSNTNRKENHELLDWHHVLRIQKYPTKTFQVEGVEVELPSLSDVCESDSTIQSSKNSKMRGSTDLALEDGIGFTSMESLETAFAYIGSWNDLGGLGKNPLSAKNGTCLEFLISWACLQNPKNNTLDHKYLRLNKEIWRWS